MVQWSSMAMVLSFSIDDFPIAVLCFLYHSGPKAPSDVWPIGMSRPPGSSGIPYPGGSSLRERFNWSLGPRCFIPMRPRLAWIIDVLFMSWNLKKSMVFFLHPILKITTGGRAVNPWGIPWVRRAELSWQMLNGHRIDSSKVVPISNKLYNYIYTYHIYIHIHIGYVIICTYTFFAYQFSTPGSPLSRCHLNL